MANHNHLSSATCYNVAMHKHDYYNQFFELGQQKINFKFYELSLPDDDLVFTLKNVMEEMDFTALLAQYSGKGKSGFVKLTALLNCVKEIWRSFSSHKVNSPKEMLFMVLSMINLPVRS